MTVLALIVFVVCFPICGWQAVTGLYRGVRYGRIPTTFSWWPLALLALSLLVLGSRA